MSPWGLIEGILLAALGLTILLCRRMIADYLARRIDMNRREALAQRALELKRRYREARAAGNWQEAARMRREYQRVKNKIRELDQAINKEKAPGDVAASTEGRSEKTTQVYHDSGEDARHD